MPVDNSYVTLNQKNYTHDAESHAKFGLKSTLFLAYRDSKLLLEKHLFERFSKTTYRIFDYGCGAGLSTSIYANIIKDAGYNVEIVGADICPENLDKARIKVPEAEFVKVESDQSLEFLGKFDLIICNFVLLEHPYGDMVGIVKRLQPLLDAGGVLISTNATRQAYKTSNNWYTLDNSFEENAPQAQKDEKFRLGEDQTVSLSVTAPETGERLFRFFDFFHSGKAYRHAYSVAGFQLAETHKPLGRSMDGVLWKSEYEASPYKIHILYSLGNLASEKLLDDMPMSL